MNVAFIPVRGGSKSIPLKNIKEVFGKPLVYWTIRAACGCREIDKVYVATDSELIKDTVERFIAEEMAADNPEAIYDFSKVQVIGRSKESAVDTASTEFAMLEFAESYDFDNIVLIQATSPLLTSEDLNKGFDEFNKEGVDSVFSVVREKKFCWEMDENGFAHARNYDPFNRPRRQEFDGILIENGAFYITSKELLLSSGNRFSGNIRAIEMPEDAFIDIDEPTDLLLVEKIMRKRQQESDLYGKAISDVVPEIKMFLTDCDGCLTDAGMYYSPEGDLLKKYNTKDGMGIRLLRERGILTGIVTGEKVDINKRRVEKLKMDIYEPGCKDKLSVVKRLCKEYGIDPSNVAFVGDDINDIEAMEYVGYPCTVADGHKSVKAVAKYIAKEPGGHGAVRDIVDHILGL